VRIKPYPSWVPPPREEHVRVAREILRFMNEPVQCKLLNEACWSASPSWRRPIEERFKHSEALGKKMGDGIRYTKENLRHAARDGIGGLCYGGAGLPCVVFLHEWVDPELINVGCRYEIVVTDEMRSCAIDEMTRRWHALHARVRPPRLFEAYVSQWAVRLDFMARWPKIVIEPSNEHRADLPAIDDLRFNIGSRMYFVDVATRNKNGAFGGLEKSVGGQCANFHLLCDYEYDGSLLSRVFVVGWCLHPQFSRGVPDALQTQSLDRLIVQLNMEASGLSIDILRRAEALDRERRIRKIYEAGHDIPHFTPRQRVKHPDAMEFRFD
jgi:hypothetical protein